MNKPQTFRRSKIVYALSFEKKVQYALQNAFKENPDEIQAYLMGRESILKNLMQMLDITEEEIS